MVIEFKEKELNLKGWTMGLYLDYICENIGKKEKDKNDTKKIFKLISQYYEDLDEVRHYIKKHYPNDVLEIWDKAVSKK